MSLLPPPPALIRPAALEDIGPICVVLNRSVREICAADYGHDERLLAAWTAKHTPEMIFSILEDPQNSMLVACRDEQVVGMAAWSRFGEIRALYLLPQALHKGVAAALLETMEQEARRAGLPRLRLNSTITAQAFYARHGYRSAGPAILFLGCIKALPMVKNLQGSNV